MYMIAAHMVLDAEPQPKDINSGLSLSGLCKADEVDTEPDNAILSPETRTASTPRAVSDISAFLNEEVGLR